MPGEVFEVGSEEELEAIADAEASALDDDVGPVADAGRYVTCGQLFDIAKSRPGWRVVKAIKGRRDAITPLQLEFGGGRIRYSVDHASTPMHRHGQCSELLDIIGEAVDDEAVDLPVLFQDISSAGWKDATSPVRVSYDADVKWIKLVFDD